MTRADLRFALLNLLPAALYGGFIVFSFAWAGGASLVAWCLAVALAVGLWLVTGVLRTLALRHGWFALGAGALFGRLATAVAIGSVIVQFVARAVIVMAAALGLVTLPAGDGYGLRAVLIYSLQVAPILGMWTAIWVGWQLLRHNRQSEIARLRAESQRHALELDALRARLNPHFVFNALNNARALINEDTERARELITRLSSILRHALEHSQRESVPLAEELAVVDDYLAVEAVHYEERLQVRRSIATDAADALIPPMLLQLLVENAIKHGIALTRGGGMLEISARLDGRRLKVEVASPGRLEQGSDGHGVGLAYLRARLARAHEPGHFELKQDHDRVLAQLEIAQ